MKRFRIYDDKGPTIFGLFLILFASIGVIFLFSKIFPIANAREPYHLKMNVSVEREVSPDEWVKVEAKKINGVGAVQFFLNGNTHRLAIKIKKPRDLSGVFKVKMPNRSDGVAIPKGVEYATIYFGPNDSCEKADRCKPLGIEDIGIVSASLVTEKSEIPAIGSFILRPFDKEMPISVRPTLTYKREPISCGDTVKEGFWIFAGKIGLDGSSVDSISLCVVEPDGDYNCSNDKEYGLEVRARKKGEYRFCHWTKELNSFCCSVFSS